MPPITLNGLLGDRKSNARKGLCELVGNLVAEGSCMNKLEALRLLEEELYCLQAEERGMLLIIRGWGETMDLGLLNNSIPEKKLSDWAQAIRDVLQVTSARRQDWNTGFIQTTNMSLAFKEGDENRIVDLSCRYTNYDLDDNDEDSLETDPKADRENEEDEYDENDEEASHERLPRHQNQRDHIGREQLRAMGILDDIFSHSSDGDDHFYDEEYNDEVDYEDDDHFQHHGDDDDEDEHGEDHDEDEHEEEEDDDDDDEDEDDDNDREQGDDKTRVDFTLKSSQTNVENGKSNVILRVSFTTCSRHVWDPVLYEDDNGDGDKGEKGEDVDYYKMFAQSGTGSDREREKKLSQLERLYEDTFLRRLNPATSKPKVKKNFETFFLDDQCECNICSTVHGFRVEVNWKELYRLSGVLDPILEGTDILPKVLYRPDAKVTDPTDDMFPFVRAVRIMSFFLVFCGGSSGYAISPVDMLLGTLISTGIPIFSGWNPMDFLDAYADVASDESLGVD